ncbi:nucleotide sugar dehydrogenase [Sphingosinicella sp. LHD-64]|uniref:nucleotide sugar dehydrogenase n=1 Tax=Sphingosinicella sp. LHD-64 TaxID=3072139 RepID=UPI00280DB541|nr:nucleotide sugar dehydrogenase [Sphingosinicella sp. LHD-64]MDQ8757238.1 nucleotide sugar dehydrogenase [Sphingosinicella sp. LHD-64]
MSVEQVVVVGLGYVGLPLAVALARTTPVTGFDIDEARIAELRAGHDRTGEVESGDLASATLSVTADAGACRSANIYIVTVPTPVDAKNRPDLTPILGATRAVAKLLNPGQRPVIVYESTVYPGVTEEVCVPLIEAESGLKHGRDFFVGYSPERINPGDRTHRVDNIVKVVAGDGPETLARLVALYEKVTEAGVFPAASIKVAEAAKVIENAQRDINIAFINEITQIFARLDLSIWDVLDAASTKWNFLPFQPGLVGGHCIGVDPYYLSFRAQQLGHKPDVILAGRAINDAMGVWVADAVHAANGARVGSILVLGLTFKENVPDLRNSRVVDVIRRFQELGHAVTVHDPLASAEEAQREYDIALQSELPPRKHDIVFAAVPHDVYRSFSEQEIHALLENGGCVADLKGMWRGLDLGQQVIRWSL